ncbi:hypothetical protein J1605_004602 [Eschrichtius robustus]|uniref:GDP-D-mannose dehydratase n=1 Tax=Eschrichtius robustus TaxID=9764 RepID=A0AB34HG72_ESCRO|nr:hypothetical protein J1605_004602 [Eschrichtius robustus]
MHFGCSPPLVQLGATASSRIQERGGPSTVTYAFVICTAEEQAMWLMLQNDEPEDFVIATGEVHSVREFVEKSFLHIGKTIV